jgi:hypothetical protein
MGGAGYVFSALRGTVKTLEKVIENGDEKLVPRMVALLEGDPVPATVADDELEKLIRTGSVVAAGKATNTEKAIAKAAAAATPGQKQAAAAVEIDLSKLAEYADDELAGLWAKATPKVSDILGAVGSNGDLAAKALAAEKTATKGDGRKTLVPALEKVIEIAKAAAAAGGGTQ